MPSRRAPSSIEPLEARIAPAVFLVNTNADAGPGSLREAITQANLTANAGVPDEIRFALPVAQLVIQPLSQLPTLTEAVVINGYSQGGAQMNTDPLVTNAILRVEIDGSAPSMTGSGLVLGGTGGSTVTGLVIRGFKPGVGDSGNAILIQSDNNVVAGNFLGTDVTGALDRGNANSGVSINDFSVTENFTGNVIGGTNPEDRNLISGNSLGITLRADAAGTQIRGNLIGTNAAGTGAIPNDSAGIFVENSNGNSIGSPLLGSRNVISGNDNHGVRILGGQNNTVERNIIGLTAPGNAPLPNQGAGVQIAGGAMTSFIGTTDGPNIIAGNAGPGIELGSPDMGLASNVGIFGNRIGTNATDDPGLGNAGGGILVLGTTNATIGSPDPADRNIIVNNGAAGITIGGGSSGIRLSNNAIHSNLGLGINLEGGDEDLFGSTANDPGDGDAGENGLQNHPVFTSFNNTGANVTLQGSLNSTPGLQYRLEFFAVSPGQIDPSGRGEGAIFLGSVDLTTMAGDTPFNFSQAVSLPLNTSFSATATPVVSGSTSEFSPVIGPATVFTWTGGAGTGDWFTPANWNPNGVPGANDTAIFNGGPDIVLVGTASVRVFQQSLGTLAGNGTLNVLQTFTWTGGVHNGPAMLLNTGTAATLNGPLQWLAGDLTNGGAMTVGGGELQFNQGQFINMGAGSQLTLNAGLIDSDGAASLTAFFNDGAVVKQGSATFGFQGIPVTNSGTITSLGGVLAFTNYVQQAGMLGMNGGNLSAATPLQLDGGILFGTGTITGSVLNNGANVQPGNNGPGLLTVTGGFTQTAGGAINIDLAGLTAGTQYDQLSVGGTAALAGQLIATATGGFIVPVDGVFTVIAAGSRGGTFGVVDVPPPLAAAYSPTSVVLAAPGIAVTTTADTVDAGDGVISLREAITFANSATGRTTITFAIPATDPNFIDVDSGLPGGDAAADVFVLQRTAGQNLPALLGADGTTIDATSQTAFGGDTNPFGPEVEMRAPGGSDGFNLTGLILQGDNNVVRGLSFRSFGTGAAQAIVIAGDNNAVVGNYIGTDPTGTTTLTGTTANRVGVLIDGGGTSTPTNNRIGGTTAADRNVMGGNGTAVLITGIGASNNLVLGNFIGTQPNGTTALGNGEGVRISTGALLNRIGGVLAGEGNIIANNGTNNAGSGVAVASDAGLGNTIRGNAIFNNFHTLNPSLGLGIDLDVDGITANDTGDGDGGPNGRQNDPVLSFVTPGSVPGSTRFVGTLNSTANTTFLIDFYASFTPDPLGFGEAERYVGSATVATGPTGDVVIDVQLPVATVLGELIAATATDPGGSTSEFSALRPVSENNRLTVTNTTDVAGPGSLRQMVVASNFYNPAAFGGQRALIDFNIPNTDPGFIDVDSALPGGDPGADVFRIIRTPNSNLATLINPAGTIIDGRTQTTFGGDTNPFGPEIFLTTTGGSGAVGTTGLILQSNNNEVRGLTLSLFQGPAINLTGDGNLISGNFLGTNATGNGAIGNGGGVALTGANNLIGGTTVADRNVISGNNGTGITITGAASIGNMVRGNFVGIAADGVSSLQNNGRGGIFVTTGAAGNTIGGAGAGEANIIAMNRATGGAVGGGVTLDSTAGNGNAIRANSIFGNFFQLASSIGLGIDLGADGVTANDAGDGDPGANALQNFPVITGAFRSGTGTTVNATLNSTAGTVFTIDFFANTAADPTGFGEGQTYLGSFTTPATDGSGDVSFVFNTATVVPAGSFITATATSPTNSTSEFSQAQQTATIFVWDGSASTDWFTAANWDLNAVPGALDIAILDNGALPNQPVLNAPATIAGFQQSAGTLSGTGTLTLTQSLAWSGGTQSGTGATTVSAGGTATISGAAAKTLNARTLNLNAPTVVTSSVDLTLASNATVNNAALFDLQTNIGIAGSGTFANLAAGTLRKSTAAGTSTIAAGVTFAHNGLAEINAGTLQLQGGGTATGDFSVAGGASLQFAGGTILLDGGVDITGAGSATVSAGTVNIGNAAADTITVTNFSQTGGTTAIAGGSFTAGATLAYSGGTLSGTGTITGSINNTGATIRPGGTGAAGTLTITGSYTQSGSGILAAELGGTGAGQFDVLSVTGNATLDGTLDIAHLGAFTPAAGNSFRVVQSANNPTTFTTLTGQTLGISQSADATGLVISRVATVFTWDAGGGADQSWFTAANWDVNAVPSAGDTAILGINATINLAASATIATFNQSDGIVTGAGDFTVSTSYTWLGGTLSGPATLFLPGGSTLTLAGAGTKTLDRRFIDNSGTVAMTGNGALSLLNGPTITNRNLWDFQGDGDIQQTDTIGSLFANLAGATLRKSVGNIAGGSVIALGNPNLTFNHSGAIEVQNGVLAIFGSGGTWAGSPRVSISPGTVLQINGGTFAWNAAPVLTGGGTLEMNNGTINLAAGTTTVVPTGLPLSLNGGTITGAGTLTIDGALTWTGGTMSGTGATNLAPAATGAFSGTPTLSGRTFNNSGTITHTAGALQFAAGGILNNLAGALYDIQVNAAAGTDVLGGTGAFNNTGTLRKSVAASDLDVLGVAFNNLGGTIAVQTGILRLENNGVSTGGTFNVTAGATLDLTKGQSPTFTGNYTGAAGGTILMTSGTLNIGGAGATLNFPAGVFQWNGGTIAGPGALTNAATGFIQVAGGTPTLAGPFSNAGTLSLNAGTLSSTGAFTQTAGATVLAGGSITKTGTAMDFQGGELRGIGTITGSVNNAGATMRPGGTGAAGLLTITGNYTQSGSGILAAELGGLTAGTQYDRLAVGGTATLAGILNVPLINAFAPPSGSQFQVVTAATVTGTFGTVNAPPGFTTQYNATNVTLVAPASQIFTWDGSASTNWDDPNNWTPTGNPGPADTAILDNGALPNQPVLSTNREVATFQQSAGTLSGAGTLTINTLFGWTGGTQSGTGMTTITIGSTLNIGGAAGKTLTQRTLALAGNSIFAGAGNLTLEGTLNNSGLFDIQTDADMDGAGGVINNAATGTFRKSAGVSVTQIGFGATTFNNTSGIVEAQTGTLQLATTGTGTDGTWRALPGATLLFGFAATTMNFNGSPTFNGGGQLMFGAPNISLPGAATIAGVGTMFAMANGTLTIAGSLTVGVGATFAQSGSVVTGAGSLIVNGTLDWSSGLQSGTGTTTINGTALLSGGSVKALDQRTFSIAAGGTAQWTGAGNISLANSATLSITGVIEARNDASIVNGGGAGGAINLGAATGIFRKLASAGTTTIGAGVSFNLIANGSIDAQTGTLRLESSGNSTGDGFVIAPGAVVDFAAGLHVFSNGPVINGGGTLRVSGATVSLPNGGSMATNGTTLSIESGTFTSADTFTGVAGTLVNLAGGALTGAGALNTAGNLTWSSGTLSGPGIATVGGTTTITGASVRTLDARTLNLNGATNIDAGGNITFANAAIVNNAGLFTITGDGDYLLGAGAGQQFNNLAAGTIRKTAGTGMVSFGMPFTNAGAILATVQTLNFGGAFTQTAGSTTLNGGALSTASTLTFQGGTLSGSGTITGNVNNTGATVRPGGTGAAGTLTITGTYIQSGSGILAAEIGGTTPGTQHDQLAVGGTATLGSTLAVTYLGGFVPAFGNVFEVVTAATRTGTFSSVTGATLLTPNYTATAAQLVRNAVTFTWDAGGGADRSWFNPLNWDADLGVPGAADTAILGINATIDLPSNNTVASFQQSDGNLNSPAGMTLAATNYTWTNGTIFGGGTTSVSGTLTISGAAAKSLNTGSTLVNNGTANFSGGSLAFANNAGFANVGTFNALDGADIINGGTPGAFVNDGTYNKSGAGATDFTAPFANNRNVNVDAGTLTLAGGGTSTAGTFDVDAGAMLDFAANHTLAGVSALNGAGTTRVIGGTLTISGSTTVQTFSLLPGGTIAGTGTLTVNGSLAWTGGTMADAGTTTIAAGATLTISGAAAKGLNASRTLTNNGTTNLSGAALALSLGSIFNNAGTFNVTDDADIDNGGGLGTFNNSGNFNKTGAGTTTAVARQFNNSGTLTVTSGSLNFLESFTQTAGATVLAGGQIGGGIAFQFQGGELRGAGTINGNVNNTGATIRPGGTGVAGTITIAGNFTQSGSGILAAELGGTAAGQFDVLAVTGTATLGATLNLANLGGFTPTAGQQFRIVTSSNNPGTFATLTGATTGITQQPDATGLVLQANAVVFIWDAGAGADTSWFNPINWQFDAGVPGAADTAILNIAATINLPADTTVGTFQQSAGTFTSPAGVTLTIANSFDWTGGTQSGAGTTAVPGAGVVTISGAAAKRLGRTLSLDGAATWTAGNIEFADGALSVNGAFDIQTDADFAFVSGTNTIAITNTLRKTGGVGVTEVAPGIPVSNNGGLVSAATGTLRLSGGGGGSTGTFRALSGATLEFAGGNLAQAGATTFDGPGTIVVNGGSVALNGGGVIQGGATFRVAGGSLSVAGTVTANTTATVEFAGGALAGSGILSLSGVMNWSAGAATIASLTIETVGTLRLTGAGAKSINGTTLTNAGAATVEGTGFTVLGTATINNSGVFDFQTDSVFASGGGAAKAFNNLASGTLRKSGGAGAAGFSGLIEVFNSGAVESQSGTFAFGAFTQTAGTTALMGGNFSASATITFQGGTLSGAGMITGNVSNTGANIQPGGMATIGTLTVSGNFTQTGGELSFEVAGLAPDQFDVLAVGGAANLGGTFSAAALGGFVPPVNSTYTALTANPRNGTFTNLTSGGLTATYTATTVVLNAPTTIVSNTNDAGFGSLRNAILNANANAGVDMITFNIPGAGIHTIAPASALPTITDPVVIDGYTQPGAAANTLANGNNAVLLIALSGAAAGAGASGLDITAGGSTVRGLVINGFGGAGAIVFTTGGANTIAGNFIGTNAAGTAAGPGNFRGVFFQNSSGNLIGGLLAAERNVISASAHIGLDIAFGSSANVIQGNFIGTNAAGTAALGNATVGVFINDSPGNTIGGMAAAARNVISGNGFGADGHGVSIAGGAGATANVVQGNFIGTDVTGTLALANNRGVDLSQGSQGNTIGGVAAGAGNLIAFNANDGIRVLSPSRSASILGNSIHSNGGLGIDLEDDGFMANDANDGDGGGNDRQNFPLLTGATLAGAQVVLAGSLDTDSPNTTFRIEFFSADSVDANGVGQGRTLLFTHDVLTDGAGDAIINAPLPPQPVGTIITATATNLTSGNTSEFAIAATVAPLPGASVSIADAAIAEGPAGTRVIEFTLTLSERVAGGVTVNFQTGDFSNDARNATAGVDYDAAAGVVAFSGTELMKTIQVSVRGDLLGEPRERFVVNLTSATNAVILDGQGVGAINDDDHHLFVLGSTNRSVVRVFDSSGPAPVLVDTLQPFSAGFRGGVRVATGDVNGDGVNDIICGAGIGGRARVRVYDGVTHDPLPGVLGDFLPFGRSFRGGVYVAAGDLDGDGRAEIIVSRSAGSSSQVRVFDGTTGGEVARFTAFGTSSGGVRVAAGDVNGDGLAEVITASGYGSQVRVFAVDTVNGTGTVLPGAANDFRAFEPKYRGGIHVAAGDTDLDGRDDIIIGRGTSSRTVNIFESDGGFRSLDGYVGALRGVRVGAIDVNSDGIVDILAGKGPDGDARVSVINGATLARLPDLIGYPTRGSAGIFVG